ncbi:hypothetical protein Q1695_005287 [Nippostrongylus brasiliensis]|nr:hypothetical protein Q1695_005287 [Nippostrongylus brasiliensis]
MRRRSGSGSRTSSGAKYGVEQSVVELRDSENKEKETFERVRNPRPAHAHLRSRKLKWKEEEESLFSSPYFVLNDVDVPPLLAPCQDATIATARTRTPIRTAASSPVSCSMSYVGREPSTAERQRRSTMISA